MTEDFLSWVWQNQCFIPKQLYTTCGKPLRVFEKGQKNLDSGPDFFNSSIEISQIRWAGNVEIHKKSSDWNSHNHQTDPSYNNVILHVVYEHNKTVLNSSGNELITLQLKEYIPPEALTRYNNLLQNDRIVSCKNQVSSINRLHLNNWLDRLLVERIESKISYITSLSDKGIKTPSEILYYLLARNFGFGVNSLPFEMLAGSLPINVVLKNSNQKPIVESLIFGQAGLLAENSGDDYVERLLVEYQHQAAKYSLKPIPLNVWKFSKMRPRNFPTIRIAQFSELMMRFELLKDVIINENNFEKIITLLQVNPSEYWADKFLINKPKTYISKMLGVSSAHNIIINSINPFLYWIGKSEGDEQQTEKCINFYNKAKPESNRITKLWKGTTINNKNGADSQALIQLVTNYCIPKKCLNCTWGTILIEQGNDDFNFNR